MSYFDYSRRAATPVRVGRVVIAGDQPVRLQSMTNTSTMDTDGSVAQCSAIAAAGADIVRLTAQGVREAVNLGEIRRRLREQGVETPLVADIHFNPKAAFAAAPNVEKVRINPGNFVDPGRTFRKLEYTDEEYQAELERIDSALTPFLELCRANSTAIRIGVNHGSLSDRIMSRFGDTPAGMVESAMEFLRVCRRRDFNDVVISIKASNVGVMVETVRRLVRAMDSEGMSYPLHLGVTEAGDGEDGRVKSAVGIGTLLAEGIGDTIRVSLSENPENEIPVARMLADYISSFEGAPSIEGEIAKGYDPVAPARRNSCLEGQPIVMASDSRADYPADTRPDIFADNADLLYLTPDMIPAAIPSLLADQSVTVVLTADHANPAAQILAAMHRLLDAGVTNVVIPHIIYKGLTPDEVKIRAAADFGRILMSGFVDGLYIDSDSLSPAETARLAFGILQAARLRMTHTEFIACPGCGRTLFDLQSTLREIKAATAHLKGLKIGVMGCIVNGPGEMADADYGYVGAGAGKISLYKGKECVERNIPASEAIPRLIQLLKDEGVWHDPS